MEKVVAHSMKYLFKYTFNKLFILAACGPVLKQGLHWLSTVSSKLSTYVRAKQATLFRDVKQRVEEFSYEPTLFDKAHFVILTLLSETFHKFSMLVSSLYNPPAMLHLKTS